VNDDPTISIVGNDNAPSVGAAPPLQPTRLSNGSAEELPCRFGRYELQSLLGQGGMARVFQAELRGPAGFRKPVALKVISPKKGTLPSDREMFDLIQEARLGGRLKHPNLVDVYELGVAEGQLFIAMELVEGLTLRRLVRDYHPIPKAILIETAVAITAGLKKAHGRVSEARPMGLIHCDLKPSNILVSWDGEVKVGDFGISIPHDIGSNATGETSEVVRGTVGYQSPEQIQALPLDGRSDLFNVGLVITEMVLGHRLFEKRFLVNRILKGEEIRAPLLTRAQHEQMEQVATGLGDILLRCLAPNPANRYPSASALERDLRKIQKDVGYEPRLHTWLNEEVHHTADNTTTLGFPSERTTATPSGVVRRTDLPTLTPKNGNIEPSFNPFVGRETEFEVVDNFFKSGTRMVTLKGFGGAGKTRFSRRFARTKMSQLTGGAWFVDLTESASALGVLQATASVLNVPLEGKHSENELVSRVGRGIAAKGPVLIVLDNFEQVVAEAPATVGKWLKLAPEAMFLVTSRSPLKLPAEQVFSLEPLPETDGATLYKLRAHAAGASWQESDEVNATIHAIVQRLDGLPLAIELAAARTRMMSHGQILDRLSQRFQLLSSAHHGEKGRKSTLRGLIDWSWELLEPWEQSALAQLSVFRNGFFMEAAESVLDLSAWPESPWNLDVVGSLLDKSLLHSRQILGQPRFEMYVSIQEYAAEKLDDKAPKNPLNDKQETQQRHAAWYGRMSAVEEGRTLDFEADPQGWARVSCELENLVAGAANGNPESAAQCSLVAMAVACLKGPISVGVDLSSKVLDREGLPTKLRLQLEIGHARCLRLQGRVSEATKVLHKLGQQETRLLEIQNPELATLNANRLMELAALYYQSAQYDLAEKANLEALETYTAHGHKLGQSAALVGLGSILRLHGKGEQAAEHYEQAIVLQDAIGNHRSKRIAIGQLGSAFIQQGKLDEAEIHFRTALNLHLERGDKRGEGMMMGNLGLVYQAQGNLETALRHFRGTLKVHREYGDSRGTGIVLGNLGFLLFKLDRMEEAQVTLEEAIRIMSDSKLGSAVGAFRGALARVLARKGLLAEALKLLELGEPQVQSNPAEFIKFICNKGCVQLLNDEFNGAVGSLDRVRTLTTEMGLSTHSEVAQSTAELERLLAEHS
jgi:serine/threonine protein kinase/predicted ATPase/Tfp pilus assembly protein PilF